MNEPQLSAEEVIKKDFPDLAEGMAAHCITTTVPDEPNGQPLDLWVMPIGQVVSWMRIANKQALATALEEQRAETLEDFVNELLKASNVDIDQESKNHIVQIYQSILNGKDV